MPLDVHHCWQRHEEIIQNVKRCHELMMAFMKNVHPISVVSVFLFNKH